MNFISSLKHERIPLPSASRILIVLMGSIGDVVRGLSVVSALKRERPDLQISWLIEPRCEPLVRGHPLISEVLVFDRKHWLRGLLSLRRELRARQFDLVLDLQRHFKSGIFSHFTGAPVRVGFHPKNSKEFNWLFNNRYLPFYSDATPKIEHYQKFVELLGIKHGPIRVETEHVKPSPAAQELIAHIIGPAVGVVLKSAWVSKDWPEENLRSFVSKLRDHCRTIVLVGDKSAAALAGAIEVDMATAGTSGAQLVNSVGRVVVSDLVPMLRQCAVVVGPDTGPAHISAALGVPYITLFGPTSAFRTAPFGYEHLVIQRKLPCRPCYRRECPGLGGICMSQISADEVLEKALAVLRDGQAV